MAQLDGSGRVVRANAVFTRLFAPESGSLRGRDFADLFPSPAAAEIPRMVVETGEPFRSSACLSAGDGAGAEIGCWDWTLQPLPGGGGKARSLILTLVDRTAQRGIEEEHFRLAAAVEQAVDGVMIITAEGGLVYSNPACREISGFSDEELRRLHDFQGGGSAATKIRSGLRKSGSWKGRLTRTRKDGRALELEVSVSPLRDARGDIRYYIIFFRDVTRSVKLQHRVRQMERMEALGRLAGGVAHDLNNILLPIIINTEMLLKDAEPGTVRYETLQNIFQAAHRQKDLVKKILAFSRRTERAFKPLSLSPLLEEVMKLVRASLPSTQEIRLRLEAGEDVILCDPTEIHEVVMNICGNASDAMKGQIGILDVSLANERLEPGDHGLDLGPGVFLKLSVSDTGSGIKAEDLEHIFDPFFTTKKPGEGIGIGLSVVHGIVKSHGGAVGIKSRVGQGTRVDVYFPMAESQIPAEPEALETLDREPGGEWILLVDDEKLVLESVAPALESLGYKTTAVQDACLALELFKSGPDEFDLALLDQTMPRMSGLQVAAEMLRLKPGFPIILATGYSSLVDEEKAKALGIREIITKPVSVSGFALAISRALGKRGEGGPAGGKA
jgi:PAS domain S-box-containing protein